MRWRPLFWLCVSVFFFLAAAYFWRLGDEWAAQKKQQSIISTNQHSAALRAPKIASQPAPPPIHLLSEPGNLNTPPPTAPKSAATQAKADTRFVNRLSNTSRSVSELARRDKSILLRNALLDTEQPIALNIPLSLRSEGDPGTYIVQSRGALDNSFRAMLQQAGATVVPNAYIPNNAYLVRASAAIAQNIAAIPSVQVVLSYEPYYKLQPALLNLAVDQKPLPQNTTLNLLLFGDSQAATLADLQNRGLQIVGDVEQSKLGPIVKVRGAQDWVSVARLPGVQVMEVARARASANDLSRERLGVATNSVVPDNYLGLTGNGVLVNINDTGVDASHPDLTTDRVSGDVASSLTDTNGHGTHVAGIIASSGAQSLTVTNALGSLMPPTNNQFRGMAPRAKLFAMSIDATFGPAGSELSFGPGSSDSYLQETAARTNAFISNNSWHYFDDTEYDLAAASYDAAVRDAVPEIPGSQPMLYVFAAGNSGGGDENGTDGTQDTIQSPATAKNVITVGGIEQNRGITNEVWVCRPIDTGTNGVMTICFTNEPWIAGTDSSNEVASFSSRGNVGVNIEGDFGRFKPDVVAPSTFVVSTTEKDHWDQKSYYNPTNYHFDFLDQQSVDSNSLAQYSLFVPYNAVQFMISVFAPIDLPIYVKQSDAPSTTVYDARGTNFVSIPPDASLSVVEDFWHYAIFNPTHDTVPFSIQTEIVTTNDNGNYFEILSNMNDSLGPFYRYETGTSMAAGDVSGMLALMQEFFEQRHQITNSPAMMKALLINGSRTVAGEYDMRVSSPLNHQGWGLPNLANSIPTNLNLTSSGSSPMLMFDQKPEDALASGQSRTYTVNVKSTAIGNPLRFTLVWTDPAGNPIASTKLVNDLDLIVTNLDTGDVYLGNDILHGSVFNIPWDTNTLPNVDVVNNVENIFIEPDLAASYSVTVLGKRVNVNAVTAQTNDVVQDYALVISSGDGEVSDALSLASSPVTVSLVAPNVTRMTNQFSQDPFDVGGLLLNQRAGGNTPLLGTNSVPLFVANPYGGVINQQITIGMTNQWHFYIFTNTGGSDFTNAGFLTFLPPTLSDPRMGVRETDPKNATRSESDIDLYVSTDPELTNLAPAALLGAQRSLDRGGTETVVLSNAVPGQVYYIGVKSEAQEGAEYGFLGVFSNLPFSTSDSKGNQLLRGFPINATIPDGTPNHPGGTYIMAICPVPITVKRVVVTNTISHQSVGDLFGQLDHAGVRVVLNNHSGVGAVTNQPYIYNDNGQHDIPFSQHTDGPGNLRNYGGIPGVGQWRLTMIDNAPGNTGTNVNFFVWLEKQDDLLNGTIVSIGVGDCVDEFLDVPIEATNLTLLFDLTGAGTGGTGPINISVCPVGASGGDCTSFVLGGASPRTNFITIDKSSDPPLNPGLYIITMCNNGPDAANVFVQAKFGYDLSLLSPTRYSTASPLPILDDAVVDSSITVTDVLRIASIEVGVRIAHPRVSDLVLHLISPDGTRILLAENRGTTSTEGMGNDVVATNISNVASTGGFLANTNIIDTGLTQGVFTVTWDFFQIPDDMRIYYDTNLIFDTGLVSGSGTATINFGTNGLGTSTLITIIMNQGNNSDQGTAWQYTVLSAVQGYHYLTFTENTNETLTPIKFAIPPLTNANYIGTNAGLAKEIFYFPEDSLGLNQLLDTFADGTWTLEVWDNRAGATNPTPMLKSWQLSFLYSTPRPEPITLVDNGPRTNTINPGHIQYYLINVPNWASFATNSLLFVNPITDPVNVIFNQFAPPAAAAPPDTYLLVNSTGGQAVLNSTNAVPFPQLLPGFSYYIGIQNTNATAVTVVFQVNFDVTPLTLNIPTNGVAFTNTLQRYFSYDVTTNETAVSFLLTNMNGNADLVVSKVPFPDLTTFQYGSFNFGSNDEDITIFTNSDNFPLTPGRWYAGVFGRDVTNVSYTIVVIDYTNALPPIIVLTNGIPYANSNPGVGNVNDYYEFIVNASSVRAQFEINSPSANMALVAKKGLPLPDINTFDYRSDNPGIDDELIVVITNSIPVRLTPGPWFLTAVNVSGGPASYSIKATEWPVSGGNLMITNVHNYSNSFFCITWTSLPGVHYFIQGKMSLTDPIWSTVTNTGIIAVDYSTTECIPLPSPYHFFRVAEGLGYSPTFIGSVSITNMVSTPGGFLLQWSAPSNSQFVVQWTPSLAPPAWADFPTIVTSTNTAYSYLDTTATGAPRFYRLQRIQ